MVDQGPEPGAGMCAVTISREYGSGGGEIAARLAKRLGWRLIDHEVVVQVARTLGVSEAEAEVRDERADSLVAQILASLAALRSPVPAALPAELTTDAQVYENARQRVVAAAIAAGQVVIVGRGAQVLLAGRRDVLHARIVTPLALRIAYVVQRERLSRAAARERIVAKDRDRARFLQTAHAQNPQDAHLYDLVVNTAVLDLDSAVDLLILALHSKGTRLATPADQLGPGAGMDRYARPPGNLNLPGAAKAPGKPS